MGNKIKFNLKNVHIAKQAYADGVYSYEAPVRIPGAVNLSLEAEGESNPFYADGIVYFRSTANNGYSGDLELAMITEWLRENILREEKDSNGVFTEKANNADPVYFALLFEFDGDQKAIRHVMYNCAVTGRPSVASQTKEDSIEPVTETISISCAPREDGLVKARTGDDISSPVYANWYNSVYVPEGSDSTAAKLSTLEIGALTLTPAFSAGTTLYEAETTNDADTVTATAAGDASVAIEVNNTTHTSGSEATWENGTNTVVIAVSGTGLTPRTYTVVVRKAAG